MRLFNRKPTVVRQLDADEISRVAGGGAGLQSNSQMSMITLQSLVQKRSTELQLVTNIMSGMNSSMASVASSVGH